MNDHERYAEWDAAYVLGALAPHDRKAFEVHLGTCPRCQAAVAELMPLPGLLAHARPVDQDEIPEPPADLLDRVRARRRRRRIRPRLVLAGAAVAAAIAAAFVLGTIVPLPSSPPRETVALRPAAGVQADMRVGLDGMLWGTRLSVTCDYPAGQPWGDADGPWSYALTVTDTAGRVQQVSTWRAVPGKSFTFDTATAVPVDEIAALTVRTSSGEVVFTGPVAEAAAR